MAACADRGPQPRAPSAAPVPASGAETGSAPVVARRLDATIDPALPACDPLCNDRSPYALVKASQGACRTAGVLARRPFNDKGGRLLTTWPVLILDDGCTLMLESLWLPETALPDEVIGALEGQRIEVAGVLHVQPPLKPGYAENYMHFPTLAPVAALRPVAPTP